MLVRNAKAYVKGKFRNIDILIRGERIAKIGKNLASPDEKIIDARGLAVFPGFIDMHVHFREPGETHKEDFLSGSKAALAGGYALAYDMPNNMPKPTVNREALEEKRTLAKKALCEVRFHFGATDSNFDDVRSANPESLKMYLGETTGGLLLRDRANILKHMQGFPSGRQIFLHAEGKDAELAVGMAKKAGRKVHLTHAPSLREIALIKSYRMGTVDCAPHHLFLHSGDLKKLGKKGLVKPALRDKKEISLLWKNLDKIDAIATDHAPHLLEDKMRGACGFPGLETAAALFFDAYSRKKVSLEWIASRFSENPARIMGLTDYGRIEEGCVANLTFADLRKTWAVQGNKLFTRCAWSPFEGKKLKGKIVKTVCRGKVAFNLV